MDSRDLEALKDFDPSQNIYLTVVKDKEGEHLEAQSRNILGRLWMKLGCSSSSMTKVAKYIADMPVSKENIEFLSNNQNEGGIYGGKFDLLKGKMGHYLRNHSTGGSPFSAEDTVGKINLILYPEVNAEGDVSYLKEKIESCNNEINKLELFLKISIKDPDKEQKADTDLDKFKEKLGTLTKKLEIAQSALEDYRHYSQNLV
jgi:hypothetical protein